ncbi:MAG: TIGR03986 family CRISPR-associated RAMP protein [Calditrichaceae bacterium]
MADWKSGKICQENNAFFVLDKNGNRLGIRSRQLKSRFPEIISEIGGQSEIPVYYLKEYSDIRKITTEKPAELNENNPTGDKNGNNEEAINIDQDDFGDIQLIQDTTTFEPPKDPSRAQGNASSGAFSPYNFVNLPDKPVMVSLDTGDNKTYSGTIECGLTNLEPLFIMDGGIGEKPSGLFFHLFSENEPCIPATSLKGALRSIVEAATGNGYDRVENRFFFVRDMGPKNNYAQLFLNINQGNYLVNAGFLHKRSDGYYIQPASWAKIRKQDINGLHFRNRDASGMIRSGDDVNHFNDKNNSNISFSDVIQGEIELGHRRLRFNLVQGAGNGTHKGRLVLSGPMNSKQHETVFYDEERNQDRWLRVSKEFVAAYEKDATDFKTAMFGENLKFPDNGIPVFYLNKNGAQNRDVYAFGRSQMFRIPYKYSLKQYVPPAFKGESRKDASKIEFCQKLFGTENFNMPGKDSIGLAGKVSVGIGRYAGKMKDGALVQADPAYCSDNPRALRPLNSPKPSSYQLYLNQKAGNPLKDYFSDPNQSRIAGRKFYWHQSGNNIFDKETQNKNILSSAKPLAPGHTFKFSITLKSVSAEELGAILWAIEMNPESRWKIGMGKPLGMGSSKIDIQKLDVRQDGGKRYQSIWPVVSKDVPDTSFFITEFKNFVTGFLGTNFDQLPHIKDLYSIFDYSRKDKKAGQKQYMDIEKEPGRSAWRNRYILPKARDFYGNGNH